MTHSALALGPAPAAEPAGLLPSRTASILLLDLVLLLLCFSLAARPRPGVAPPTPSPTEAAAALPARDPAAGPMLLDLSWPGYAAGLLEPALPLAEAASLTIDPASQSLSLTLPLGAAAELAFSQTLTSLAETGPARLELEIAMTASGPERDPAALTQAYLRAAHTGQALIRRWRAQAPGLKPVPLAVRLLPPGSAPRASLRLTRTPDAE